MNGWFLQRGLRLPGIPFSCGRTGRVLARLCDLTPTQRVWSGCVEEVVHPLEVGRKSPVEALAQYSVSHSALLEGAVPRFRIRHIDVVGQAEFWIAALGVRMG